MKEKIVSLILFIMDKLKLTPEEEVIFQKALSDAYNVGNKDSTFLFNGMHELIQGEVEGLKEITKKYLEK